MHTGRLVHTGQVVLDLVMRVPALPPVGGDVFATESSLQPGGGFNVMAAAARAGADVVYAGGHGDGQLGDAVRGALAAEGIMAALVPSVGVDTGVSVAMVDDLGERTFVTAAGAESALDPAQLAAVPITAADIVYLSGYSLVAEAKRDALLDWLDRLPRRAAGSEPRGLADGTGAPGPANGTTAGPRGLANGTGAPGPADGTGPLVLVDPGPLVAEIAPAAWARVLERVDVLSCNAREARLLTGLPGAGEACRALGGWVGAAASVLVRDGAAGCWLARGGVLTSIPGVPVTAVDTNGAGDAHCGVLAAELLRGADLAAAAVRANAAAALAVTRPGPATAPTRAEVDALLAGGRGVG
ncbi:MAG TPA: PfkB family carbohydrate kinase [Pseudonocardia sp.]|nr:PfkB family carbohydrate kinase [Pseudonocardia sp.]